MTDKSLKALLEFLDWTAEKGLMARNTVGGRKAAVTSVLGVLDPEEAGDVTTVDLDNVMTRFINLHGRKYNNSSLNVYKSRTNAAINDFARWLSDPLAFKPQSKPQATKSGDQRSPTTGKPNAKTGRHRSELTGDDHSPQPPSQIATANVYPIPIRSDLVVRIHGLPFDLTKSEAEKIANVVKAMAMGE